MYITMIPIDFVSFEKLIGLVNVLIFVLVNLYVVDG